MQRTIGGSRTRSSRSNAGAPRFARLSASDSSTADLLYGCPVVTATGEKIGTVDYLMVDVVTHQLRYVVLAHKRNAAVVSIPWHALYFDAAMGRLVFYTLY
ncbi:MAG TPA: PRC-barrel domain-containing protein [Noviherbaspirillum sp.]|uniref:PRC-barrel domain-containing protein n=1 Tax=Noviherbaspirillum sp. TaxID=1926288 RepID=UPI002D5C6309|nr:PRC-barrel domain-containing protein [Noviherbaspirillum sp.]HYD94882.1 PRC-barrel domain-containing protein [Noviherbaspirillum sp.]